MAKQTREQLLDDLVQMTRARDRLADSADRLIGERDSARAERDRYREALERIAGQDWRLDPQWAPVMAREALDG